MTAASHSSKILWTTISDRFKSPTARQTMDDKADKQWNEWRGTSKQSTEALNDSHLVQGPRAKNKKSEEIQSERERVRDNERVTSS